VLGSGFTLAATVGGTIGLGILRTPGEIATVVTNPLMFVSLWVFGGLFSLLTAIVVSELIGMTPRSGGTYALVRRAYGPFPGFVIVVGSTGCGHNHIAGPPEPDIHEHAPNSPGTGGRWPGHQARRGNLKRWQSDLCGATELGLFGLPDHNRRIPFPAAPSHIFRPVHNCSVDRGSHYPSFAPAGR
jgi:hypothetical protein